MQEPWTIVGVVLLAVLVGAALPVLFQLYSTLRVTRSLLDRLGPKMDSTLAEVRDATGPPEERPPADGTDGEGDPGDEPGAGARPAEPDSSEAAPADPG